MTRIACIGECMVELVERADRLLSRGFGGDTLNTAVYLARLGARVDYVTALGDDAWSDEMFSAWRAEGIGTDRVLRLPGRTPGLYLIQTDANGERRFSYWRDSAPARDLFRIAQTGALLDALTSYDLIYFSGITLSLYGEDGRATFFKGLDRAKASGARLAFDTNFRPRGWPDRDVARRAFGEALARADIALSSTEDLEMLFEKPAREALAPFGGIPELVLKEQTPGCQLVCDGNAVHVPAESVADVVDTTAAGDSFAAAYLWARTGGAAPPDAARAGHRLAGTVVRYPGAIIPRSAMPVFERW
ncbi:MAG TPA: sugar kinase [Bradyrhizobium sp.]|nr:sugar kinase [Bradyrhizobium sp.]